MGTVFAHSVQTNDHTLKLNKLKYVLSSQGLKHRACQNIGHINFFCNIPVDFKPLCLPLGLTCQPMVNMGLKTACLLCIISTWLVKPNIDRGSGKQASSGSLKGQLQSVQSADRSGRKCRRHSSLFDLYIKITGTGYVWAVLYRC